MTHHPLPSFRPLPGVFEPSAVLQLPDGRFLVVEDEKSHPLSLLAFGADGPLDHQPLKAGLLQMFDSFWQLDDLEGLTLDRAGFVYAVTSHSRDGEGAGKKARERLVRFRVEGERVVDPQVVESLRQALTARHPVLAAAAKVRDVKADGGLNIEALEMSADQQRLLIGFRSPLRAGRALIASLENPAGLFDADEPPRIAATLDEIDLGGHGIRSLAYVPAIGEYLLVGGPVSRQKSAFDLWCWSGERGAPARRIDVPGLPGLEHAEGLCAARIDGVEHILIVSDDGDRAAGRPARYLLLDPARLQPSN